MKQEQHSNEKNAFMLFVVLRVINSDRKLNENNCAKQKFGV